MPRKFESIHHDLLQIESGFDLLNRTVDGVSYWERIRFELYRDIFSACNVLGEAHTEVGDSWRERIKGISLWARNLISHNPYFAGDHDFLFFGHPRRKIEDDGTWWDVYIDPLLQTCQFDYTYIEYDHELEHKTPARTKNIDYVDFIRYSGTLSRLVLPYSLPESEVRFLHTVEAEYSHAFGVDLDLVGRVENELAARRTTLPLYRRLLKRINPNIAVLVVSYGKESFIEACQSLDVPVAELQHGVITEYHYGYSYPNETKSTFPDYFLSFGPFWHDNVPLPVSEDAIFDVGYPYLSRKSPDQEQHREHEANRNQILFISQGTIGEDLSRFAVDATEHVDESTEILYKLHPGEYTRWRTEYPWLVDADLTVIDGDGPSLYQLFERSDVQVGVYSTAVYEGLFFGVETYIINLPGSSYMENLVKEGAATLVNSPSDLLAAMENGQNRSPDPGRYFVPEPLPKMKQAILEIKSRS